MRTTRIAGYILLQNPAAYKRFKKGEKLSYDTPPDAYPVFARAILDVHGMAYPIYLNLTDTQQMKSALTGKIEQQRTLGVDPNAPRPPRKPKARNLRKPKFSRSYDRWLNHLTVGTRVVWVCGETRTKTRVSQITTLQIVTPLRAVS